MKKKYEVPEIEKEINKLTDKFEAWEILETLFEKANAIDRERLRMDMIDILKFHQTDTFIVKVDSMQLKSKLEDFVGSQIYPHYSDQQMNILSY